MTNSTQNTDPKHVAVLGAGIVGVCTALYLQRDGHRVTLIDREPPGRETSFGNAAMLQVDASVPLATPGVLKKVPSMLSDPEGPLVIRWRHLPGLTPWLMRFVSNARPEKVERISIALASLLDNVMESYAPLWKMANAEDLIRRRGNLVIYRDEKAYQAQMPFHEMRTRRGVALQHLDRDELHQLEPALADDVRYGVFSPDCGSVANPLAMTEAFADAFARDGGEIVRDEIRDTAATADGVELTGDAGTYRADALVLATGPWSKPMAAKLGATVPLAAERGYHLMLPHPGSELRIPLIVGDHRFGIIPLADGIRLAGTSELATVDADPDWNRADMLAPLAKRYLKNLDTSDGERWMGRRPAMPDSVPVIGRAPGHSNVFLAFGHGHLGLTFGAVTGRAIADLVAGRAPVADLAPFAPDRF